MLTIKQLVDAYFGEGSVFAKAKVLEHEDTALALRRVEAAVRASDIEVLREYRDAQRMMGQSVNVLDGINLAIRALGGAP